MGAQTAKASCGSCMQFQEAGKDHPPTEDPLLEAQALCGASGGLVGTETWWVGSSESLLLLSAPILPLWSLWGPTSPPSADACVTLMACHFLHGDAIDAFSFCCWHLIHSIRINKT